MLKNLSFSWIGKRDFIRKAGIRQSLWRQIKQCINPPHNLVAVQSKRFTPQFRRSDTLIANNFRCSGPFCVWKGTCPYYVWVEGIMSTNKKATTARILFRRLAAVRLILFMLNCPPVWAQSPQTVSNQDLMNMKVASASENELKITQTAPTIYKLYVRHKWYGSSITAHSPDCKSSRRECERVHNARRPVLGQERMTAFEALF